MEKIQVTDEWLYKYMPVAAEALLKDMEEDVNYEYDFSVGFEKKMKRLMRRERHMVVWDAVHRIGRKFAHIAAVALILAFVFSMSSEAYRIVFFDTIRTAWEDSFLYRYIADTGEEGKFSVHAPSYLPEGYFSVGENANDHFWEYLYENEEGMQLICQQEMVTDGKTVVYDNEFDKKITLSIYGCTAEVYRYEDDIIYSYFEFGNGVYTIFAEGVSVEDIKQIFSKWVWK